MKHRYGRAALLGVALGAMLVEVSRPRELATLPNTDGFKFTGHKLDGTKVACIVRKVDAYENDGKGGQRKLGGQCYSAQTLDGRSIYRELCAWSPEEL